ncbi:MAG TPA: hypothetical protein VMW91_08180 [Desulfosporosinus sp.]|nr:hypothetical protein [Desulfosporosinus sp.]
MILKKLLLILTLLLIPSITLAGELSGNLNILYGYKYLNDGDWEPVEDQTELGVSMDFKKQNWPVSIALEFLHSDEREYVSDTITPRGNIYPVYFDVKMDEIALGVRKNISLQHNINLFFGGGITMIRTKIYYKSRGFGGGGGGGLDIFSVANQEVNRATSDEDSPFGFWASARLYTTFAEHYNIGVQVRWSKADVTLVDEDVDAGGLHGLLFVGYHW